MDVQHLHVSLQPLDELHPPRDGGIPGLPGIELGVKFRAEIDGLITGVRFYKGAGNTGTHLGHLWTTGGAQLGEVTFTNETSTGWQTASFATPIPISAGTTYIASYHAPRGNYALNRPYFTSSVSSGPLTAPADGESGGNAVFKSGVPRIPEQEQGSEQLLGRPGLRTGRRLIEGASS